MAGVVAGLADMASGQPGRGRRGGGGGDMGGARDQMEAMRQFPIDALWSAISFGLDLEDTTLASIRPILANAWKQRNEIFKIAKEDDTWKAAKERMEDLREQVEKQLEGLLTKDQMKVLKKLQKEMRKNTPSPGR